MARSAAAAGASTAAGATAAGATAAGVTAPGSSTGEPDDTAAHRNEVLLVGRLSGEPTVRVLPSGEELIAFRVVVRRPPAVAATTARRASVDTIDCSATRGDVRRALGRLSGDDLVEVSGALHRRFWRGPGGLASRYEVDVLRLKRLRRGQRGA